MNRTRPFVVYVVALTVAGMVALVAPLAAQQEPATAEESRRAMEGSAAGAALPASDFERLLELEGEWEAIGSNGQTARVRFEPIARGTAIYEELLLGGESMSTVYHLDGDRMRLTHFCGSGNQPRMKQITSAVDGELRFAFVDVTNLASPLAGHMREIAYVFGDGDHFTQKIRWREGGQEVEMVLDFERQR